MSTTQPACGPRAFAVVGTRIRILAGATGTGGAFAVMELLAPPGSGVPPHVHHREAESFLVLEGEVAFNVHDRHQRIAAGGFVHVPVGVPHSFVNEGNGPVRMIVLAHPAGLENFFAEAGAPIDPADADSSESVMTGTPPTQDDIERLTTVAKKYGIEML